VNFLTAVNTVARGVDVLDTITAAQLGALTSPEVRRIADEVNTAYFYFYSHLTAEECPRVFDSLTINTAQVTFLPDSQVDTRRITRVVQKNTNTTLYEKQYEDLFMVPGGIFQQTGTPVCYYTLGDRLGFAPKQDKDYTYFIMGARKATRLLVATEDLLVPEQYSTCVTDLAQGYLKLYHRDPDAKSYVERAMATFKVLQGEAAAVLPVRRMYGML